MTEASSNISLLYKINNWNQETIWLLTRWDFDVIVGNWRILEPFENFLIAIEALPGLRPIFTKYQYYSLEPNSWNRIEFS